MLNLYYIILSVAEKSAEMADKDPHGIIMSVTSISVVFLSLLVLYLCYTLIGKIVTFQTNGQKQKRKAGTQPNDEEIAAITLALEDELTEGEYAAIAMALYEEENEFVHDIESYVITIKR